MKRIELVYVLVVLTLVIFSILADWTSISLQDSGALQTSLLNITGIVTIGLLSVSMILVLRLGIINRFIGGLDKSYRLHKWLAITGFAVSVMHWLLVKVPEWTSDWPPLQPADPQGNSIFEFLASQYAMAVEVGDITFKFFVVLVILAMVKKFPYKYFFKTHRLLSITYLFLVIHSVILLDFSYWNEIIAPIILVLISGGCIAAFISLFRKIGSQRRVVGVIDELVYLEESNVLRVVVAFKDKWPGHDAGQFAFVTFDRKEGPHPFTISSPWINNGKMFFLIKGLGDYTNDLRDRLNVGDFVEVEGPYGQFIFDRGKEKQIWVAGGIGVVPFVAQLKALSEKQPGKDKEIDLFYTADVIDEALLTKVRKGAKSANVRLHVVHPPTDGRLDFQRITELAPQWESADIWFCGPSGFGKQLKKDAVELGVSTDDFHQELFNMR